MTWYKMDVGRGGGAIKKNPSGYLHVGYMAASGLGTLNVRIVVKLKEIFFYWVFKK